MKDKIPIEEYKGFKIFYDKEENQFVAEKEGLDLEFTSYSGIGMLRKEICNSKVKAVNKDVIVIDGYFNKELSKIRVLTKNTATNKFRYKKLSDTENNYGVGEIKEEDKRKKFYKLSERNLQIFDEVKALEKEITEIGNKQKKLVCKLR